METQTVSTDQTQGATAARVTPAASSPGAGARAAAHDMRVGATWFAIGLIVTLATYAHASSSSSGGHYLVWWGPVIFGAIRFFKGLSAYAGSYRPAPAHVANLSESTPSTNPRHAA